MAEVAGAAAMWPSPAPWVAPDPAKALEPRAMAGLAPGVPRLVHGLRLVVEILCDGLRGRWQ